MTDVIRQDRDAMGELFIWTDVDPDHEQDFNQWYDREHMAERASIPGFVWARRYRLRSTERRANGRYLALYRTESLHVFGSPAYRQAFENQTPWSLKNFARMKSPQRRVMAVSPLSGAGTGGALALVRLDTVAQAELAATLAFGSMDGVLAVRVLTPDPELSTPLPSENESLRSLAPFLVIDTTTGAAAQAAVQVVVGALGLPARNAQTFDLLWELRAADLNAQA